MGAWLQAARPATLVASVSPVLTGSAVAVLERGGRLWPALGALTVALALQVGVNFANDYSDFRHGADTPDRIGPPRLVASGLVPPRRVLIAALATFAVAAGSGAVLALATDWRLIVLGAACLLAGWFYTGGPRPYGYLGLGEVFVFVFFGLVATAGSAYVQELRVTPLAVVAGVPIGCLAVAVLLLNNLRDIATDAAAGKRTLAVRLGRIRTRRLLFAVVSVAFLVPTLLVWARLIPVTGLLPLLAIPLAARPLRLSMERDGPTLIRALKTMAALELAFAVLWAVGILLP